MKKRDRNNCLFYYVIMKILTIIALIGSILSPIKSDRYKNSINNTGSSSFNNFVQITYEYYCEEPSYTVGLSAGVISGETQVPLIYSIKLNIKLRNPVTSAYIKLKFTSPLGTSPYWEIPALCENAKIDYVDADDLYVYLYNTDYASIYIVYTYEQVMKRYGYQYIGQINALDPMSPEWIEQGYTYCDLTSISLESATLSSSSDYSSQLNSIMAYTDGIENYLSQIVTNTSNIVTNTSYLSTISTNISSINTTLTNIKNSLTYVINGEQLYNSLMFSLSHRVDNIQNVLDRNIVEFYEGDYVTTGSGPTQQSVYITIWDSENHINDNYDRNKLKLVFVLYNYFDCQYYYLDVPIYNSNSTGIVYEQLYLIKQKSYVICIQASFKVSQSKTEYFLGVSQYTLSTGNLQSGSARSTNVYKTMLTDASITTNQKLDDLINIINNEWNIEVDTSDKLSVDNWYEQLKQSLDFPNVDQQELTQGFQKMGKIIKYYGMLINNSNWILFPKIILISAMFKLFGVIIS